MVCGECAASNAHDVAHSLLLVHPSPLARFDAAKDAPALIDQDEAQKEKETATAAADEAQDKQTESATAKAGVLPINCRCSSFRCEQCTRV